MRDEGRDRYARASPRGSRWLCEKRKARWGAGIHATAASTRVLAMPSVAAIVVAIDILLMCRRDHHRLVADDIKMDCGYTSFALRVLL